MADEIDPSATIHLDDRAHLPQSVAASVNSPAGFVAFDVTVNTPEITLSTSASGTSAVFTPLNADLVAPETVADPLKATSSAISIQSTSGLLLSKTVTDAPDVTSSTRLSQASVTTNSSIGPTNLVAGSAYLTTPPLTPTSSIRLKRLTKFSLFTRFPPELRNKVWKGAASEGRDVYLMLAADSSMHSVLGFYGQFHVPGMLQANRESRNVGKSCYTLLFDKYDKSDNIVGKQIYFNPNVDVLFLTIDFPWPLWEFWVEYYMYRRRDDPSVEQQQMRIDSEFCSPCEMEVAWAWESNLVRDEATSFDEVERIDGASVILILRKRSRKKVGIKDDGVTVDEEEYILGTADEEETNSFRDRLNLRDNVWWEDGSFYECRTGLAVSSWCKRTTAVGEIIPYMKKFRKHMMEMDRSKCGRSSPSEGYEIHGFGDLLNWDKAWRVMTHIVREPHVLSSEIDAMCD